MTLGRPLRDDRVIPVACGVVVLLATFFYLLGRPFPSGSDPGHMLAYARGVEGSMRYAPLVPVLFGGIFLATGGAAGTEFPLIDLFAVLSVAALSLGMAVVTAALTPVRRAQGWAFFLGAANPVALYELLWGGLAQFWGLAFASICMAGLLRWRTGWVPRIQAALFGVLTVYTHAYAAAFLAVSGALLLGVARPWEKISLLKSSAVTLSVASVLVLPISLMYGGILAAEAKGLGGPALFDPHAVLASLAEMLAGFPGVLAGTAVLGCALARWILQGLPKDANGPRIAYLALAVGTGFLLLLAITPSDLAVRPFYVLPLFFVPFVAVLLAGSPRATGAPSTSGPPAAHVSANLHAGRGFRRPLAPLASVRIAAIITAASVLSCAGLAASSVQMVDGDHAYFSPLPSSSIAAFQTISKTPVHAIAVYSPLSNFDAWWIEGFAGKRAVSTDLAQYYTFADEIAGMQGSKVAASGEEALRAGNGSGAPVLVASPSRGFPNDLSVLLVDSGNVYTGLALDAGNSQLIDGLGHGRALRAAGVPAIATFSNGTYSEAWSSDAGPMRGSAYADNGSLVLLYAPPPGTSAIHFDFLAGPNSTFDPASDGHVVHSWVLGEVSQDIFLSGTVHRNGNSSILVTVPVADGKAILRIRAPGHSFGSLSPPLTAQQQFARLGIDGVYLRAQDATLVDRFSVDPAFHQVLSLGSTYVFQMGG